MVRSRRAIDLTAVLVLLIIADGIISQFLGLQGMGQEANPFLQPFIGGSQFLPLKIGGGLLAAVVLWDLQRRAPKGAVACIACFDALYTGILYWNVAVFLASAFSTDLRANH